MPSYGVQPTLQRQVEQLAPFGIGPVHKQKEIRFYLIKETCPPDDASDAPVQDIGEPGLERWILIVQLPSPVRTEGGREHELPNSNIAIAKLEPVTRRLETGQLLSYPLGIACAVKIAE